MFKISQTQNFLIFQQGEVSHSEETQSQLTWMLHVSQHKDTFQTKL